MRYVFDIETNGFLHSCDTVHCIVLKDIDTGEILTLDNDSAVKKLEEADLIVCLLYTSPSPRDRTRSRMPSSA